MFQNLKRAFYILVLNKMEVPSFIKSLKTKSDWRFAQLKKNDELKQKKEGSEKFYYAIELTITRALNLNK
ncbi:MAG: hypothetical protein ACJAUO_002406 [Sediminicola sp.]|jgi:hypothetical protein